ncbi:MAG: KpsF/GutQ family sugar-phosphate isomerase [Alphaproteobacteria bacterium]
MTTAARLTAGTTAGTASDDVAVARRVLAIEADGLNDLARSLDARFSRALDLLGGITGRVVVTGMGKSGHVARKIAATLASTGTPSLFVHPGEASHGDLGMITRTDAVLALSNSGKTPELTDIITYARRIGIPLLAITSGEDSLLAREADVALILPASAEACPMGLAPTTSTTVTLALGDAIAIALLERRGFGPDDFRAFHPGGQLGRRLVRVADIMHGPDRMPLVGLGTPMSNALITMSERSFGCVGVVDGDGRLTGIVTDGDLRRHMSDGLLGRSVDAVMTRNPVTIGPEALAATAIHMMNDRKITSLFVVEGQRPTGIVHIHDCLRFGVG